MYIYTAEDFINFIESQRFDKISRTALELIAKWFRELENNANIDACLDEYVVLAKPYFKTKNGDLVEADKAEINGNIVYLVHKSEL